MQCSGNEFLRNDFPIPRANHIIHSVVKNLAESLEHYQAFVAELKVLEQVLVHPGRKERLVAKCFLGTPFGVHAGLVRTFSMTLYEKRWNATEAVIRPTAMLRRCWSQEQCTGNGDHDLREREWGSDTTTGGRKCVPAELTRILRSGLFRFYMHMMIILKRAPTKLPAWWDGCPCHEFLALGKTAYYRNKALVHDGLAGGICPCILCRAWQVADGKLEEIVSEVAAVGKRDLEILVSERKGDGLTDDITDSQISMVMRDFHAGCGVLEVGFGLKFAYSKNLPYILMGLCHPVPARRQHWARRCLAVYGASPEHLHHRKSVAFLKDGTAPREDIKELASAGITTPSLEMQVSPFLLIPFGDRQIEQEHKPLSDVHRKTLMTRAGDRWSIQRMKHIEQELPNLPWQNIFVEHYCKNSFTKGIINALGLEGHPPP